MRITVPSEHRGRTDARLSDSDLVAKNLARHMMQSISSPVEMPSASAASEIGVSDTSQIAQSLTHNLLAKGLVSSDASIHSIENVPSSLPGEWLTLQEVHTQRSDARESSDQNKTVDQAPSDRGLEEVARGVIFTSQDVPVARSAAESLGQLSQNGDSVVAQSIARNLILDGMHESEERSGGVHVAEETMSDGYAANGLARELVTSASQQRALQHTEPSSHQERSGAVWDEEVEAILRQTIDGAGCGTSVQSKTPPSMQESEKADSMVADFVAKQIVSPHSNAGSNRDFQEQVYSESEGYVAQAVAIDLVASNVQHQEYEFRPTQVESEQAGSAVALSTANKIVDPLCADAHSSSHVHSVDQAPSDRGLEEVARGVIFTSQDVPVARSAAESHGQLSQNGDSVVAQSIARNLILDGMHESEERSGGVHVAEETMSDGYAANGLARELVTSASQQRALQHTEPSSHHERSSAVGDEEVEAILRQTIDGAGCGTSVQSKTPPSMQESEKADSMVADFVAKQIVSPHSNAGSNRDFQEQVYSESEGYVAQAVAIDLVASNVQHQEYEFRPTQVESEQAGSAVALSTANKIVDPLCADAHSSSHVHSVDQAPSDRGLEEVARGVIFTSQDVPVARSAAESHGQLSQNGDSVVAQSIARNLILDGMHESEERSGGVHVAEETMSDGYAANGLARELVTSASQQRALQHTEPSSHHERSSAVGDEEVEAILRQTIDGAGCGTSVQSKTPPSMQESEKADSMVADFVAKQIVSPHSNAGSNRDFQEQVYSESEGYVAQAVAIDLVASNVQHQEYEFRPTQVESEQAGSAVALSTANKIVDPLCADAHSSSHVHSVDQAPSDRGLEEVARGVIFTSQDVPVARSAAESHGQLSQNGDSVVAQSIARNLILDGMHESEERSGGVHVAEGTMSDGYAANGLARELVTSASQQRALQHTEPSSHHERSSAVGDEEVEAILRQTIDGAGCGTSVQSKTPPSMQESEKADSMVADFVAKQIVSPHSNAGSNRDFQEQVYSESEGYVAQAVAIDLVASNVQHQEYAYPPSQVESEQAGSAVAQSLAREAVLPYVLE
eukprot:Skav235648  [mRNA]  locus=scaffold358:626283:630623:- [translate_table: standard]